jgi:hypothetical protein
VRGGGGVAAAAVPLELALVALSAVGALAIAVSLFGRD